MRCTQDYVLQRPYVEAPKKTFRAKTYLIGPPCFACFPCLPVYLPCYLLDDFAAFAGVASSERALCGLLVRD
jgi:hypothetical protein